MNILRTYLQVFYKASPYSLYVLFILFVTFMLDQLDRYALPITCIESAQEMKFGDKSCLKLKNESKHFSQVCSGMSDDQKMCEAAFDNETNRRICKFDFNGQGFEYQIVSGPVFNLVFTCTGVIISIFADKFQSRRVFILAGCLVWWSLATIATGSVMHFWQLAIFRLALGIGEAGCTPIATSIIADYFSYELRGSALSIYYWGIYTGYSLSYVIGNEIMKTMSWRWVYRLCGLPGFFVAVILVLTVKQKNKVQIEEKKTPREDEIVVESSTVETQKFRSTLREFIKPSLICLCLAGSIRMAAGDVWAYNNNTYYKMMGRSPDEISRYQGTIPMIAGIIGSFLGGFLSDRVAQKADPSKRIWVLVLSQLVAAPFVVCVLYFEPPYSYYCLIPTYIFGEMWIGVCLSVVVELVPDRLRITGIGIYFFIITNIGGNMNILVPVVQNYLQNTYDLTTMEAFRGALYVFFPGEYIVGSLMFLISLLVLKRDLNRLNSIQLSEVENFSKTTNE